jgi:hypothetical protein
MMLLKFGSDTCSRFISSERCEIPEPEDEALRSVILHHFGVPDGRSQQLNLAISFLICMN